MNSNILSFNSPRSPLARFGLGSLWNDLPVYASSPVTLTTNQVMGVTSLKTCWLGATILLR